MPRKKNGEIKLTKQIRLDPGESITAFLEELERATGRDRKDVILGLIRQAEYTARAISTIGVGERLRPFMPPKEESR